MAIKFIHHKGHDNKLNSNREWFILPSLWPQSFHSDSVVAGLSSSSTRPEESCSITLVITLALLDSTFESQSLTSVESVFDAQVPDGPEYLPLQWKKEWLNRPVFRGSNDDHSNPMSYRTLHDYMKDHSLEMGYPEPIGPKDLAKERR